MVGIEYFILIALGGCLAGIGIIVFTLRTLRKKRLEDDQIKSLVQKRIRKRLEEITTPNESY